VLWLEFWPATLRSGWASELRLEWRSARRSGMRKSHALSAPLCIRRMQIGYSK
jgi:hypothetical protein